MSIHDEINFEPGKVKIHEQPYPPDLTLTALLKTDAYNNEEIEQVEIILIKGSDYKT